jgi:hypothetical protein
VARALFGGIQQLLSNKKIPPAVEAREDIHEAHPHRERASLYDQTGNVKRGTKCPLPTQRSNCDQGTMIAEGCQATPTKIDIILTLLSLP